MGVVRGGTTPPTVLVLIHYSYLPSTNSYQNNLKFMATEIITIDDLQNFKAELLDEIKKLMKEGPGQPVKKWLKSYDVQKMLGISAGTLQNRRNKGIIKFTKIGGVLYYDYNDIQQMLTSKKK